MTTRGSLAVVRPQRAVDGIVVGLHLRWDGVYQRPQHVLGRFARDVPVLVVEEPYHDRTDFNQWLEPAAGVTVLRPHRVAPANDAIDRATLRAVRERIRGQRRLVWLYTPMMLELTALDPEAPLVFDAMDDLASFAHADPRLVARESAVLARADMVFCGGPSLYRSRRGRARNVKQYSSGVDVDFFMTARSVAPDPLVRDLARPVYGYIGVIDERVDLALVAAIADTYPQATVAMIGPTAKIDERDLPRRANIIYAGQQPYAALPALLAGIDVALMPFARNESTVNISPTKTLEYLAAGKPVVSTAIPDVVQDYERIVTIAHSTDDFLRGLREAPALAASRHELAEGRIRGSTWDAITASMAADLAAIGIALRPPPAHDSGALAVLCPCAHPSGVHGTGGCTGGNRRECDCPLDARAAAIAGFTEAREAPSSPMTAS